MFWLETDVAFALGKDIDKVDEDGDFLIKVHSFAQLWEDMRLT